jgi:neutral ceramidase
MPFYATALALAQGDERFLIVDTDAIGFDWEWTGRIMAEISRVSGLPLECIRFSCTHTHSGPNTFRLANIAEGLDMAVGYLESLPFRIAGAAWQALQAMQPVRVAAATCSCAINGKRRVRVPDGRVVVGFDSQSEADHTLRVVRLDAIDQRPVATLLHYACHPTTIAWQSKHFTPDYPGAARQVLEREMGGHCLFLQGAAADLGPRDGFTGDLSVYRRLGTLLGLSAATLALPLETLPRHARFTRVLPSGANIALYEYDTPEPEPPVLSVIDTKVRLPLKEFPPTAQLDAELEALRAVAAQARESGDEEKFRLASALATQAGWRAGNAHLYHGQTSIDWPLQAVRIGPVALVSVAGEPFSSIGLRIAAESPFAYTLFSGYSNGGFGYIPERSAYAEGGYEIEATPFSPDAADVLVAESIRILKQLRGATPHEKQS